MEVSKATSLFSSWPLQGVTLPVFMVFQRSNAVAQVGCRCHLDSFGFYVLLLNLSRPKWEALCRPPVAMTFVKMPRCAPQWHWRWCFDRFDVRCVATRLLANSTEACSEAAIHFEVPWSQQEGWLHFLNFSYTSLIFMEYIWMMLNDVECIELKRIVCIFCMHLYAGFK